MEEVRKKNKLEQGAEFEQKKTKTGRRDARRVSGEIGVGLVLF